MKVFQAGAVAAIILSIPFASAQRAPQSPPRTATGQVGSASIVVKYSAPSVRGRTIFGPGGLVAKDKTAPIWRAGANAATALDTSADIEIGKLHVPKGDYTLFVDVKDPGAWVLIVNKQTGQWGLTYNPAMDLGRVPMKMSAPPAPVEMLEYKIVSRGENRGKLVLQWDGHVASVPIRARH